MLYEKGECYPKGKGYNYKLYFNIPDWTIQVFEKTKQLGQKTFSMSFEPRCGIDITDSNIIDIFIAETIKKEK